MDHNNKYALITGASSGIGYELAKRFAKEGYNLIIVGRNHDALRDRANEFKHFGINVITLAKNLFNTC